MKAGNVVAIVLGALLLEGIAGYVMWSKAAEVKDAKAGEQQPPRRGRRDVQETADSRALRNRIRELEQRLQANNIEVPAAETPVENNNRSDRRQRGDNRQGFDMQDMRSRMERMAKEDPERYTQMTNGFAQQQRRMQERRQARADFLSSIDTSKMTAQQKDVHAKFQAAMARQQELMEYMRPDSNATDEERRAAFDEMRELGRSIHELGEQERNTLLATAAQNMGYSAEDAEAVVQQIKEIYQVTEGERGFGGPGGPGGRFGGFNGRNNGGRRGR